MVHRSPPRFGGWKNSADIGRTVSKPIKLSVSGKDSQVIEIHSLEASKLRKKYSIDCKHLKMNHTINDIEEMDTNEG